MIAATERPGPAASEIGGRPLRWLFVKEHFAWPRAKGHDVHTHGMMRALAELGHGVSLCTVNPSPVEAVEGVPYTARYCLAEGNPPPGPVPVRLTKWQDKFRSYWGIPVDHVRQVATAAADCDADVVVAAGSNLLPHLGAVEGRTRVWYAADEWVLHHLSQVRPFRRSTWGDVKPALVKGLYERAYRPLLDRIWVVTGADAAAFRWLVGARNVDVIPNGVDADLYRPEAVPQVPGSCVFWGRLDFGPNVQAVEWFCRRVWPRVRATVPDARFRIVGFLPTPAVRALAGRDGIELFPDVPDVRPVVRECQIAVFPFVSGGGIKNKLLEAAALGMPAVCSPRACLGLNGDPPFAQTIRPADWARELARLWGDDSARRRLGADARRWVVRSHTWAAAARAAAAGLQPEGLGVLSPGQRPG
jgi:glycosyltransferase involved in cell wall biosynthesis